MFLHPGRCPSCLGSHARPGTALRPRRRGSLLAPARRLMGVGRWKGQKMDQQCKSCDPWLLYLLSIDLR